MPSTPTTPSTALTAALVASTWRATNVRLSPDGSRVAWCAAPYGKADEHAESAVWVADVGDPASARRWTHGGEDTQPRWSPDGTRLAFCSDRAERGTAGLYVLDVSGGEAAPLLVRARSVDAYAWAPDGRSLAVLVPDDKDDEDKRREEERDDADVYGERREWNRVLRVAATGGDPTSLLEADLHPVEVAWSPTGDALAVVARPTTDLDDLSRSSIWVLAADGSSEPRRLVDLPYSQGLAWWGDDRLVCAAPHDLAPCSAYTVWTVRVADGQRAVLAPGPDEPLCATGVVVPAGSDRVVLGVAEGLDSRLEWCDASGAREPLWTAPGDLDDADVVLTDDGAVVAAVAADPTQLTEVVAGRPPEMAVLSTHHEPLAGVRLGAVEDFACVSADGHPVDGIVVRPVDGPDGPAPTVVLVHGGPYGRSGREPHLHPLDWAQWLATAGYAVVLPNYRGGMGHGNDFANAARGGMGTVEWDDVMACTDAAVERGIADPDRLGIGGWSQGGFLTAWAVTQTDRFRAAVMGAGVSDWGLMAATSDLPTFEAALGGSLPWDGPGPHHAAFGSPISYAARRSTPLLILHGAEDERVPVSQAVSFHRAVRDQEAPVQLVTYPREPHGIRERRHQEDVMRRVREWFDRWLT